jgi:pyruvyltransferase
VVWGSGRNGKEPDSHHQARRLDVRAVRGPLTRAFLEHLGIPTPAVYGDPALLLPLVMPDLAAAAREPEHDLTIVPNLNDASGHPQSDDLLHPQQPLATCLDRIARSRLVVGSSLHGIIVAESLGVPARLVRSAAEHPFKYDDYYQGTGRPSYQAAPDVATAIAWGGEPPPDWTPEPLLEAFPWDLWQA